MQHLLKNLPILWGMNRIWCDYWGKIWPLKYDCHLLKIILWFRLWQNSGAIGWFLLSLKQYGKVLRARLKLSPFCWSWISPRVWNAPSKQMVWDIFPFSLIHSVNLLLRIKAVTNHSHKWRGSFKGSLSWCVIRPLMLWGFRSSAQQSFQLLHMLLQQTEA